MRASWCDYELKQLMLLVSVTFGGALALNNFSVVHEYNTCLHFLPAMTPLGILRVLSRTQSYTLIRITVCNIITGGFGYTVTRALSYRLLFVTILPQEYFTTSIPPDFPFIYTKAPFFKLQSSFNSFNIGSHLLIVLILSGIFSLHLLVFYLFSLHHCLTGPHPPTKTLVLIYSFHKDTVFSHLFISSIHRSPLKNRFKRILQIW